MYVLFIFICIGTSVNSQHYNIHNTSVRATLRMRLYEGENSWMYRDRRVSYQYAGGREYICELGTYTLPI